MKNIERFLNYVRFDTQSNPYSNISPSTNGQINFAQYLVQEIKTNWTSSCFFRSIWICVRVFGKQ